MFHRDLVFNALHSTAWLLVCLVAVVVAVVLIVILSRYERRLVRRGVGNLLLLLRLCVLLVLFLTLLEPVLSWTVGREQTGRILVALDLSESMDTTDNHASPAEKLRWARSLGMIGNRTSNARLNRWAAAFERGDEPQWVEDEETTDPEKRQQLAAIREETIDGVFGEIDRLSRKEIALRLLTQTESPLLPELEAISRVELRVFAGAAQSADETTLADVTEAPPASLRREVTDLAKGFGSADADENAAPVIGVVLLTDGRDNSGHDPTVLARQLGELALPTIPVLLGSERRPKDLSIGALDYPSTAFKDDKPVLNAMLNTSGFEGESITVVLEKPGDESATQTKQVVATGQPMSLNFVLDAGMAGRHEYTIRTEVQPGETRDDNNQKTFALTVVDDKAHVLLLDGEARWEFRFIDNAFTRDDRVESERVVFHQPFLGVLSKTFFPQHLELPRDPKALDESPFTDKDLVIVGDVGPRDLPESAWSLLDQFVAESGGTLVLVAGKRFLPLAYRSETVARLVPLTKLRPFSPRAAAATAPTERGLHLRLTPEGDRAVILQFDADRDRNRQIWSGLPGHTWALLGEAKPAATVLAFGTVPSRRSPNAPKASEENSLDQERRNAVIVHQHYGFGQVLWIGIDSTWRWRYRVGDQYHHRFWGQLARWAAETKAAAGNEFVKFGPDRSDVEAGEPVTVRARWSQPFLRKFPELEATAEFYRDDGESRNTPFTVVDLAAVEGRPLIHEGRLLSLSPGTYHVKLVAQNADLGPETISAPLYVHEKQTLERSDVSSNRELLTQIAESSGGQLIFPDEIHQIPQLLQPAVATETTHHEIALWDHWLILLVFFTFMTIEWVIRKLNGLP